MGQASKDQCFTTALLQDVNVLHGSPVEHKLRQITVCSYLQSYPKVLFHISLSLSLPLFPSVSGSLDIFESEQTHNTRTAPCLIPS